jgi:hypothetical protein
LMGLDLILTKAMVSNWSHCRWVSWHSFPNCNFRVLFICSTLHNPGDSKPCAASKLFLCP